MGLLGYNGLHVLTGYPDFAESVVPKFQTASREPTKAMNGKLQTGITIDWGGGQPLSNQRYFLYK